MSVTEDTDFPVDTFKDAARHLRRPFTAAAVKFKVQATWPKDNPTGGLIVGYIDARLVIERLNLIVPHLWHDAYEVTPKGLMWCHLTVDGITRSDVGEGVGKGLVSDALKRAAVHFGIGVSLYAIPKMTLDMSDGCLKQRQGHLEITPKGDTLLRNMYSHWLDSHGSEAFGTPLNHGDVEGSQGDQEADEPVVPVAPQEAPSAPVSDVPADFPAPPASLAGEALDGALVNGLFDMFKDRGTTVGQFKNILDGVGVDVPSDLRSESVRLGVLARLTAQQAIDVEKALSILPVAA